MNENLNLVEILKNCPGGTKLYSTLYGEVQLEKVYLEDKLEYPIEIIIKGGNIEEFTKDGKFYANYNGECVLFPSEDQRDWSKFKVPVEKFDYSILKPFDKVLVRSYTDTLWKCALFTCMIDGKIYTDSSWQQVIPYNDDTKHLAGTTGMPGEKYIWWEN